MRKVSRPAAVRIDTDAEVEALGVADEGFREHDERGALVRRCLVKTSTLAMWRRGETTEAVSRRGR